MKKIVALLIALFIVNYTFSQPENHQPSKRVMRNGVHRVTYHRIHAVFDHRLRAVDKCPEAHSPWADQPINDADAHVAHDDVGGVCV